MGPEEVVPKGENYAVTGSGYHKTYDKTVVNRANKLLQTIDKKARFRTHDPEAVIKARRGSASALWEAMTQNGKTIEEMKALKESDPTAYKKMLDEAAKQHLGHRFKITPEFREAVEKKGFSRYKKGGQVYMPEAAMRGFARRLAEGGFMDDSPPNFSFETPSPGSNEDSFAMQQHPSGMMSGPDVMPSSGIDRFGNQPDDPALDEAVRRREQPLQPHLQRLSAPQQSGGGGGGGGGLGDILGMAMKFAPMLLAAEGGMVPMPDDNAWDGTPGQSLYAEGGSVGHDIAGTLGGLAGSLIGNFFLPGIGGAIGSHAGRFLGHAGDDLVEGHSDNIDDELAPDLTPTAGDLMGGMDFSRGGSVDDDMLAYHTMFYGSGGPVGALRRFAR
jgi:hypothetical protein